MLGSGLFQRGVNVIPDSAVAIEVRLDQFPPFAHGNAQFLAHAKRSGSVHDTEIDNLRSAAHIRLNIVQGDAKYQAGRPGMNILAILESGDQSGVLTQMGHNAQFNLRIVGRQDLPTRFLSTECFADFASLFIPDGNILKIGIAAGKTPGGGYSLIETGMDPACFRVDVRWKRIQVSTDQFIQFTIV